MLPREQAVLAVTLKLFHNPLRNQLRWVWQLGPLLQILKCLKRLPLALIDNLPHVLFPNPRDKLQSVHPRRNRPSSVEEVHEPLLTIQHNPSNHTRQLRFGSTRQLFKPHTPNNVRNLVTRLLPNVNLVARLKRQPLLHQSLQQREKLLADTLNQRSRSITSPS